MSVSDPDPIGSLDAATARPTGFVTAEWRHIVILSYAAHPALLTPLLPGGVELDLWNGQPFLSVVGLLIERISVLGVRLPFYRQFEQINLRFYARQRVGDAWRRGVVFVKEFVPYWSLAFAARLLYRQNYEFARMRHEVIENLEFRVEPSGCPPEDQQGSTSGFRVHPVGCSPDERFASATVEYSWLCAKRWNRLGLKTTGSWETPSEASFEHFITERRWGYARSSHDRYLEFEVRRPAWIVSPAHGWLDCDAATLYGDEFSHLLSSEPASALLAAGSSVALGAYGRVRNSLQLQPDVGAH